MQSSTHTTSNIYHISSGISTKQLPPNIVKFNIKIRWLRILNNARSMKYSKQVVFDTMLLLLFQKSVIIMVDVWKSLPTENLAQPLENLSNNHYITISNERRDNCNQRMLSQSVGHSRGHFSDICILRAYNSRPATRQGLHFDCCLKR